MDSEELAADGAKAEGLGEGSEMLMVRRAGSVGWGEAALLLGGPEWTQVPSPEVAGVAVGWVWAVEMFSP